MHTPPWLSVEEALVAAEELRRFLGEEATEVLDHQPDPGHADITRTLSDILAGPDELRERVSRAEEVLRAACVPGGIIDPQEDQSDLPWCLVLKYLREDPSIGSAVARRWFTHLVRLRHEDHAVSATVEGVAAYGVAWAEMLSGRTAQYERWMMVGANATDHEDRPGLSLIVVVRATLLLGAESGLLVAARRRVSQ